MKIVKKSFRVGFKASKNYQSVDISEGFEAEMEENNLKEIEYFDATANDLKVRMMEQAKKLLDAIESGEQTTAKAPEVKKEEATMSKLKGME